MLWDRKLHSVVKKSTCARKTSGPGTSSAFVPFGCSPQPPDTGHFQIWPPSPSQAATPAVCIVPVRVPSNSPRLPGK